MSIDFTSAPLVTGPPVLGTPAIRQVHALVSASLSVAGGFDPGNTDLVGLALSDGNMSATCVTSGNAASTVSYTSGKAAVTCTINVAVNSSSENAAVGFAHGFNVFNNVGNNWLGSGSTSSVALWCDGSVYAGGSIIGNAGAPWNPGDTIDQVLDLDIKKYWARQNLGDWNNDATADPSTGVGGFDVQLIVAPVLFVASFYQPGDKITLVSLIQLGEPSMVPMTVRNVARVAAQRGSASISAQRGGGGVPGADNIAVSVDRESFPE